MIVIDSIGEVRRKTDSARSEGHRVALVPTMGALHRGHLALVQEARTAVGRDGLVVVSVFVNPTQFGPNEDFDAYPRDLKSDADRCEQEGVDIVFAPLPSAVYHSDASIDVQESILSQMLCGATRPGHFAGVCLIVLKLFNIVRPDCAVFGKKDYQQLAIIRRMVRDLNVDIDIVGVETVREDDGLALSSRNAYLTDEERPQAVALRHALLQTREAFDAGERNGAALLKIARQILALEAPLGRIDYLEVVDAETIQPLEHLENDALIAVAVFFGKCRLIDNIELTPALASSK